MSGPLHTLGAALLSLLAFPVVLGGGERTWPLGRGPSRSEVSTLPRRSSRRRMWALRGGSFWGRWPRRRTRRSASLGRPPFNGRPAGPTSTPGRARANPPRNAVPGLRPTGLSSPAGLTSRAGPLRPPQLSRLPRPGRAEAAGRQMEEAVPEVIDVLRATVGAGINPRRALQAAAEGAPSALEGVLDQAIRAAELGSGAGNALATAAKAEGLSELVLAGEALDLAETTGAPPGPVLSGVATAAADRVRSRQARLAATAEARLSARVVAAMAPAFLGVLALTSPSDAAFLVREPLGWATLAAAAVLELLGISWATRIVRGPAP